MKKILFLIHNLGAGGAEKVLVNLVNNMDRDKFDITVMSLFDVGVNRQFLAPHIRYIGCFKHMVPGNSHFMKLLSPKVLHKWLIKEPYDIEVSYLEGPSARVISGCTDSDTKLYCWIHSTIATKKEFAKSFRGVKEAEVCYRRFEKIICVSQGIQNAFGNVSGLMDKCEVLYNTVESEKILEKSCEDAHELGRDNRIKMVSVGTLKQVKGYDRLLRVMNRLKQDGLEICLYILGTGPMQGEMENYIQNHDLQDNVVFLGYQSNPYKYVAKCDLFVCSSYSEGFSTAATEALIVGTAVCTTDVSGMREMLGENNEHGLVVENNEDALYRGIQGLLSSDVLLKQYKEAAIERGRAFSTKNTVKAVEQMLEV